MDIWVDSVSLQPFTFDEWDAHTRRSADKARRRTVKVVAMGADDKPMAHANVSIELLRLGFPFGNAVTKEILDESLEKHLPLRASNHCAPRKKHA